MAFNSGSGSAGIGFNQNSGGYYITTANGLAARARTITDGTGSGGATTPASFAAYGWANTGSTDGYPSSLVDTAGKLIRDLGRSVISAGRCFRKFQAVEPALPTTFGVTGAAATSTNPGYLTFYLEVPRGGLTPTASVPAIARFS